MNTDSKGERPNIKLTSKNVSFEQTDIPNIIRYLLGCKFINSESTVLDIGCGYGHGVLIQSLYAKQVVGLDISKDSLKIANDIKKLKNLENVTYTNTLDTVDKKFDLITAYEIIEHINKEDGIELIKNTVKFLNKGGVYIISTPLIDLRGKTYWFHHKHEYYTPELERIMKKYFNNVVKYYSIGDGFFVQKGFLRSLFFNPLSSTSSIVLVCSNKKLSEYDYNQGKSIPYLLARGIYRNIKYIFKKHD